MRKWLRNKRLEMNYTQQEIADAIFIDRAYYSQIESGKRSPSRDVANKLATLLHFQPTAFYAEDTEFAFRFALQNIPMVLAHCNTQLQYTWIYNPHSDFQNQEIVGKRDDELDLNGGIQELMKLKQDVLDMERSIRRKISFPLSTGLTTFWFYAEPLRDYNHQVIGVVTAAIDMSDME